MDCQLKRNNDGGITLFSSSTSITSTATISPKLPPLLTHPNTTTSIVGTTTNSSMTNEYRHETTNKSTVVLSNNDLMDDDDDDDHCCVMDHTSRTSSSNNISTNTTTTTPCATNNIHVTMMTSPPVTNGSNSLMALSRSSTFSSIHFDSPLLLASNSDDNPPSSPLLPSLSVASTMDTTISRKTVPQIGLVSYSAFTSLFPSCSDPNTTTTSNTTATSTSSTFPSFSPAVLPKPVPVSSLSSSFAAAAAAAAAAAENPLGSVTSLPPHTPYSYPLPPSPDSFPSLLSLAPPDNAALPMRLLVVANRLPITVNPEVVSGGYSFSLSSGGLVSGLKGIETIDFIWIGWPGNDIPHLDRPSVTGECRKWRCHPVYLDKGTIDLYYNGFCNNVLWPLLHYVPPPLDFRTNSVETNVSQWKAYTRANAAFVEAILEVYEERDLVWVHDYHLMLVPKMLREKKQDSKIGWFMHTPFPSQELFRMLPFRVELLTGLLSANLVAFHAYDYMRHFLSSCVQLLGLESTAEGIDASSIGGVFAYSTTIPIGIEPKQFISKLEDAVVLEAVDKLRAQFGGRKVILGVDRLDYMKGIPHKLNAFDRFLEQNPDWIDKCVLVQLAVPTRTLVPEYQRLRSLVHELVGKINGKRGRLAHVPVHYLDQSLSFDELVALYHVADAALITSLRDGMNLVAYEYVACQDAKYGVLILSEFAGAAQSLGAGSIRINPWNIDHTAEAIKLALTMSPQEKKDRHQYAFRYVNTHTSQKWAQTFIDALLDASDSSEEIRAAVPPLLPISQALDDLTISKRRLLVFDFLECLVPARGNRGVSMKQFQHLICVPDTLKNALRQLSEYPNTSLIIMSTQNRTTLERVLGDLPKACLVAEKGCVYRRPLGTNWVQLVDEEKLGESLEWIAGVQQVYDFFQEHTPGSYVERTTGSLTFYWDDTLPDFGKQQSRDMLVHLWTGPLASAEVEVVLGQRSVEVRSPVCARDKLLSRILEVEFGGCTSYDFIACIGNFPWRDEDIYQLFENLQTPIAPSWRHHVEKGFFRPGLKGMLSSASLDSTMLLKNEADEKEDETPMMVYCRSLEMYPSTSTGGRNSCSATAFGDSVNGNQSIVYSISVGIKISRAKFCVPNPYHVQSLVRELAGRLCAARSLRSTAEVGAVEVVDGMLSCNGNEEGEEDEEEEEEGRKVDVQLGGLLEHSKGELLLTDGSGLNAGYLSDVNQVPYSARRPHFAHGVYYDRITKL